MKEKGFIILISGILLVSLLVVMLLSNTESIKISEKVSQEIGSSLKNMAVQVHKVLFGNWLFRQII